LTKPNLVTLAGLGVLSLALPSLLPQLRPAAVSAIKAGLTLFTESEAEAEAELIESLVAFTAARIREALASDAGEAERRHRVRRSIEHFKRHARKRAQRWGGDEPGRKRSYQRHIARLETTLAEQKQEAPPHQQDAIEDAFIALAEGG
jgi:hypothetical protein